MSKGTLNKVSLIGNVGNDPQIKYTASGTAVVNLSLATTDSWKNKESGQYEDKSEWHKIVIYNKLAEIAAEYVKKGSKIYIEGKIQTRSWQDKETQQTHYITEIIANEMLMLGSNKTEKKEEKSKKYKEAKEGKHNQLTGTEPVMFFNDEIPF
ncbi:MAG: single-stranded DNA-binding protein [Spirochaetes bacterium]|nr:MAG: single-stranded DNA-binding protein [Spirochaetota bacterium]